MGPFKVARDRDQAEVPASQTCRRSRSLTIAPIIVPVHSDVEMHFMSSCREAVTPCVSPRCRASDGRIGHYMLVLHAVCGYRMR
jgi:hypothetical protein